MRDSQSSDSSTPNFTPEFQQILESIQNNTATEIYLSTEDLGDDGIKELVNTLSRNTSLERLNIWGTQIGDKGTKIISEMLKNNDKLKIFSFSIIDIRPDGVTDLAEAVGVNTTLTKLDLSHNNIGDDGATALANALGVNQNLTNLDLWGNRIGPDGAQALAEALRVNTTLTNLDLFRNEIGPNGAQALANALRVNTTLTKLNLTENNIGDDGARELAGALRVNTTLKELDLSENKIGDDGARELAGALRVNTTLKELDLSYNEIRPDGAQALAGALSENFTLLKLEMPSSTNEESQNQIENYIVRNNIIEEIATQISNYHTQDPTTPPFPRLDDNLIKEPQIRLKIFEKSLSKIIDFKKTNGQEVNEEQIREEFIEHLKSSRGGMRFLFSCKEESNLFGLTLEDYFWVTGVTKYKGGNGENEKNETRDHLFRDPDLFSKMQQSLLPHLLKNSSTEAPSTNPSSPGAQVGSGNPSSPRANPMGFNLLSLIDERGWGCKIS